MSTTNAILHPTDFSDRAAAALKMAATLARAGRARLVIVHIVPAAATYTGRGDVSALRRAECAEQDMRGYRAEMEERLQKIRPRGRLRVERSIREGDVAAEILGAAEECRCDVIVMGTRGRTNGDSPALGSVAKGVLTGAHCPVVLVGGTSRSVYQAESATAAMPAHAS
jgi:nucleotide-binding universal stress UspA family protein